MVPLLSISAKNASRLSLSTSLSAALSNSAFSSRLRDVPSRARLPLTLSVPLAFNVPSFFNEALLLVMDLRVSLASPKLSQSKLPLNKSPISKSPSPKLLKSKLVRSFKLMALPTSMSPAINVPPFSIAPIDVTLPKEVPLALLVVNVPAFFNLEVASTLKPPTDEIIPSLSRVASDSSLVRPDTVRVFSFKFVALTGSPATSFSTGVAFSSGFL